MRKRFSYVVWLMIAFVILSLSCGKDKKKSKNPLDDDGQNGSQEKYELAYVSEKETDVAMEMNLDNNE